jgi:hypothetical protein
MASIQLRALIDSILTDTARDMREQADVVETELARRIAELSDAMQKMIYNMREVNTKRDFLDNRQFIFSFRH